MDLSNPVLSSRVIDSASVDPISDDGDTTEVRVTFDRTRGSERLEQRVTQYGAGRSRARSQQHAHELLYVVSGSGTLHLDGGEHPLEPDAGVFVGAGEAYEVESPGPDPLVVVSVLVPAERAPGPERKVVVRFGDQPEHRADANRTFRYLVSQEAGCAEATQFIGIVEPCRAPDHSHAYDEVGYIVEGEGIAHISGKQVPLQAGSCFYLPPGCVHCIENSGSGVMRIMGVFHPSGDPASRSYDEATK